MTAAIVIKRSSSITADGRKDSFLGSRHHFFECTGVHIVAFSHRKRLKRTVRTHALCKTGWCKVGGKLQGHSMLADFQSKCGFFGAAHGSTDIECVRTLFQNVSGFCNLSKVIVRCKVIFRERQSYDLQFTRPQKARFFIGDQLACRSVEDFARCLTVELNDFLSCGVAGIYNLNLCADRVTTFGHF